MLSKWVKRLKLKIARRAVNWEEWWDRSIPNHDNRLLALKKDKDGSVLKNNSYWKAVATVASIDAFMNELYELEAKCLSAVEQSLMMEENHKHIAYLQRTLYGVRRVRAFIMEAVDKTRGTDA